MNSKQEELRRDVSGESCFVKGNIVEILVSDGTKTESRLFLVLRVNKRTLTVQCLQTERLYRVRKGFCKPVGSVQEQTSAETRAWGPVESVEEIAPGIQWVTTSRHGGFQLTAEANARIPASLRQRDGLYEEDCEWCKVVLWFPEYFAKELCQQALHSFRITFPDADAQFGSERGMVVETSQCGESWRPFVAPIKRL